jgi:replicative DNA helicase
LLYREEYYNKYCPEDERGSAECVIAKNSQNERRTTIRLKWEGEYGVFSSGA